MSKSDLQLVFGIKEALGYCQFYILSDNNLDEQSYHIGNLQIKSFKAHEFPSLEQYTTLFICKSICPSGKTYDRKEDRYHGGDFEDEVAALLSLSLAIRCIAVPGQYLVEEKQEIEKHFTQPQLPLAMPPPLLSRKDKIVPRLFRSEVNLAEAGLAFEYHQAISSKFIQAVRMYQNAVVYSEIYPEITWLWLVAAVERLSEKGETIEDLATWNPKIAELAKRLPKTDREILLKGLKNMYQSAAGFRKFLLQYGPDKAPVDGSTIDWTNRKDLERRYDKIYSLRSVALHAATPFPRLISGPSSINHHLKDPRFTNDVKFKMEDLPMDLFEFVATVRESLLAWLKDNSSS